MVIPRGAERSWSSPALAAAFSLRKYAVSTKHIPGERAPRAFQGDPMPELPMTQIDLIGGNGHWRQLKAEEEFKRRRQEEEEQRRQELQKAKQKKQRHVERDDKRKKFQEEEERRWQEEREQKARNALELERIKIQKEEKARIEREEAEEERRKRMPRTCETCDGTAKCQECMGKGYIFSVFLVASKSEARQGMEHGRVYQGCQNCGGYCHNLAGALKKGTGECPGCQGLGKIWPVLEPKDMTSPKAGQLTSTFSKTYQTERSGEVKL